MCAVETQFILSLAIPVFSPVHLDFSYALNIFSITNIRFNRLLVDSCHNDVQSVSTHPMFCQFVPAECQRHQLFLDSRHSCMPGRSCVLCLVVCPSSCDLSFLTLVTLVAFNPDRFDPSYILSIITSIPRCLCPSSLLCLP